MSGLWPWLAVAGLGALHGLSPTSGWMFAAASGLGSRDSARARLALLPIAIGHAASVAIVVLAVAQGVLVDRGRVQAFAGALLVALACYRWLHRAVPREERRGGTAFRVHAHAGHAGMALWSCLMATAHGAGLMLVPALVPLCMSDTPAREITATGSLTLALAAVALHMTAMLITTGTIAVGVCRGAARFPTLLSASARRPLWIATLAAAGTLLMVLR
ncbi:hypothetical protein [Lysobacter sp. Root604]|uniref:hypothetical protein n=1 Tax=Lysobacter sp. Root604 TaxID=1736568 RepID=UPI0009EC1F2C|nr:hypothetical protein [Lysobacter sp. Root604]